MEENLEDLLLSPHLVKRRTSAMLSIKNLTKTYKGGKKAGKSPNLMQKMQCGKE